MLKKSKIHTFTLLFLLFIAFIAYGEEGDIIKEYSTGEMVTFNFVDVELPVITKFISEVTGKNFIFDQRLKGKITIIAPSKLNINDAYRLFTSVLKLKGFTILKAGVNVYKIIPSKEAKQSGVGLSSEKKIVNENYIARLIQLKFISSSEVLKFLRPVVARDGYIADFGPGNLLLVIDSGLNIDKILNIIQNIDLPSTVEYPEIIYLKNASAISVAKILNEGVKGKAITQPASKTQRRRSVAAIADDRLNVVVIFGSKAEKEFMIKLAKMLDVSPEVEGIEGGINVYFLENADAEELSKVLQGIIKKTQTQKRRDRKQKDSSVFESVSDIVITPDKATNALVIIASPSDYRNLEQVIKKLDKRPKQVYVEAMIVEVSIDDLKSVGAKWRAIAKKDGEPVFIGGVGEINEGTITSIIQGLSGFTLGGTGNFFNVKTPDGSTLTVPQFAALFALNQSRDAINILSTPQILTSDNKEAEIIVGENIPFITQQQSSTTGQSILSSIERQDVGIKLTITPQITEGDYVKLELYQEISDVKKDIDNEVEAAFLLSAGPTTTKRSTKTSIIVKDKQTVAISGLMQERTQLTVNKVPILGDIPLLGWLFKLKSKDIKKINLIIFITPHIITDAGQLNKITEEKKKNLNKIENQDSKADTEKSETKVDYLDNAKETRRYQEFDMHSDEGLD